MTKRHEPTDRRYLLSEGFAAIGVPLGRESIACDILLEELAREEARVSPDALASAFSRAQSRFEAALAGDSSLEGVGACAAAMLRTATGIAVAHLGDCRAHLYRRGALVRSTEDHRLPADRNIITRAFGISKGSEPELGKWTVAPGDVVLLTAVVHDFLSPEEIGSSVSAKSADDAVAHLVHETIARGGLDDVVAALVTVGDEPMAGRAAYRRGVS